MPGVKIFAVPCYTLPSTPQFYLHDLASF